MRLLERCLTAAISALFALMIVLVTIQVANRYGMAFSLPWTEELTRVAYVLLIFIGSALATLQRNHVAMLSGIGLLPPRLRKGLVILGALVSAAFFAFVAYGNYIYVVVNLNARFPTMGWLTIGHVIAVVFASSVLTALLFLYRAFRPGEDEREREGLVE